MIFRGLQDSGAKWDFLTTPSEAHLQSLLDGYNQTVKKDYGEKGQYLGTISHILRVYLIDSAKRIRNIYSVSFLHTNVLVNDIKTVLMEDQALQVTDATHVIKPISRLSRPGDYKTGYESADYQTSSISVTERTGKPAELLTLARTPPLGLPPVPAPEDNPLTEKKIALGRKLFYDRRLSLNNTISCAMCHVPEQGFTHNELATAVGIEGRTVKRNAPTIYNAAYFERLFHDARDHSLENQVWGPMLAANEMGNPSVGTVIEKLRNMPDYKGLFAAAFGRGPSMETIGMALASYQRTLISGNSAFDRWYYGKQDQAMSPEAQRGFALFTGKARCVRCHILGPDDTLFIDNKLHNTGVGYFESMKPALKQRQLVIAPGVTVDVDPEVYLSAAETPPNDLGRYEVTQNPHDRWKYKTPSLRNVALTAPYMHNGSLATLAEVVEFYNQGGMPNPLLDALIKPLDLGDAEQDDLVAFLQALTGDNVDILVADAFAAPVGDIRKQDPTRSSRRNR